MRTQPLNLFNEVLLNGFSGLRNYPIEISKPDAFGECEFYRIIDDAQSFQETSREGFELPVIGRLKSEALTVEDEGMRFLDVTEQEPFLLDRGRGRRLAFLGSQLDLDEMLAIEIGVACLTEALLDAWQEVDQLQNRVEPHLGQGEVHGRVLERGSHLLIISK